MNRNDLLVGLAIGLVLSLTVAVGVAWYFMRAQNAGTDAVDDTLETEINGAGPCSGDGTAGGNNARAAKFVSLETDQDGKLTLAEFTADRQPAEAARWFERRDVDSDGFVNRTEYLPVMPLSKGR